MSSGFISINNDRENVFELQSMIREISKIEDGVRLINPDGLFLSETAEAVGEIQKLLGIAPTGEVDLETWSGIVGMIRNA